MKYTSTSLRYYYEKIDERAKNLILDIMNFGDSLNIGYENNYDGEFITSHKIAIFKNLIELEENYFNSYVMSILLELYAQAGALAECLDYSVYAMRDFIKYNEEKNNHPKAL